MGGGEGWGLVVCLFDCLTSQQRVRASQGRICSDNRACCHTETEATDQTFCITQARYTDTGPTSLGADLVTPGAWQGSHWSTNVQATGMTQEKIHGESGNRTQACRSRGERLDHWANQAVSGRVPTSSTRCSVISMTQPGCDP